MKKLTILLLCSCLASLLGGCEDEGFIKVFKCTEEYPYLNLDDNRCYKSPIDTSDGQEQQPVTEEETSDNDIPAEDTPEDDDV